MLVEHEHLLPTSIATNCVEMCVSTCDMRAVFWWHTLWCVEAVDIIYMRWGGVHVISFFSGAF